MAKNVKQFSRFQGISDYLKESLIPDQYAWGRSVDYRSDPRQVTLLSKTVKESGSVVIDLLKWAEQIPSSLTTYAYGNAGNFYARTSAGSWSLLNTAPDSHGNGLSYYQEDDFVYYTSDNVIGRYGPLNAASPQFSNDFLGAQGGVPTNTNSVTFVAASSQYADRADTASLSIVSDITLEAYFKLTSLPAVGSSMTLISKWDESGSTRSYIMDILGVSGYFGDGGSGALTISSNTTEAPIDSACTGTIATSTLSATNASFAAGQIIFIHQTKGSGAGTPMLNTISSYTAGTITVTTPLNATYVAGAQVRVVPQYTTVTVNSGVTYSAKAYNGTVGGILAFIANGAVTLNGAVAVNGANASGATPGTSGRGFNGGISDTSGQTGTQGDGTPGVGSNVTTANGNGGGGGFESSVASPSPVSGGGGGGNGTAGTAGTPSNVSSIGGAGGAAVGSTDLTTMTFGGGGGGGAQDTGSFGGGGGGGAGIVFITGTSIVMNATTGSITATGGTGGEGTMASGGGGGGGAGGSILLKAQTATLATDKITAHGGAGGTGGGTGGEGRIHLDYLTSFTGTTDPTLDATQDNTLVTSASYQGRIGVSSTGANSEFLTKLINITTGSWNRLSITWKASTSLATFYLNATNLGTSTGTLTAIHNNASRFGIGMNRNGAGNPANFLDAKFDDARVFSVVRTASDIFNYNDVTLLPPIAGLVAYYELDGDYTDETANANDLTAVNTPVFTTDVPFSGPSTRLDIDQAPDPQPSGQVYNVPTAIIESGSNMLSFTPTVDPQKSLDVNVAVKGTGTLVVTVHDQQNRLVATQTISNANMTTGFNEFVFSPPWRIVQNREYHFHITSSVNDTDLVSGTLDNLSTAAYHTYFGFLVNDEDFHPIQKMLNFLAIGNERYVATWEGIIYLPNRLVLGSGWKVRSFALWNEYLAIGCWMGSHVYDFDKGRIYFWDGISTTFNFFIDVPEGAINAMLGARGELHIIAGYKGDHLVYTGGQSAVKIKRIPKVTNGTYVEVFPGAMTMWQTLLRYGVAGNTDSTTIEQGVYSWGNLNEKYPETLSYDYPISTGNRTATNIKIGMVYPAGSNLLIGWQDNVSYGADVVDINGAPFASGTIEFMVQDDEMIWRDQKAMILRGDFLPLNTGESVDIKYKLNRETNWNGLSSLATPVTTADEPGITRLPIANGQNREYQMAFDLFTTGSTSPTMLGLSLWEDDAADEEAF